MSRAEIASALAMAEGPGASRMRRAHERLQELLVQLTRCRRQERRFRGVCYHSRAGYRADVSDSARRFAQSVANCSSASARAVVHRCIEAPTARS